MFGRGHFAPGLFWTEAVRAAFKFKSSVSFLKLKKEFLTRNKTKEKNSLAVLLFLSFYNMGFGANSHQKA